MLYCLASEADISAVTIKYDVPKQRIGWPTVVAKSGDEIKGFITTKDDVPMVAVCGFVADSSRIGLRLIEAYENLLRMIGMKSYLFSVRKDNARWLAAVVRSGTCEKIGETELKIDFKRIL